MSPLVLERLETFWCGQVGLYISQKRLILAQQISLPTHIPALGVGVSSETNFTGI